MALVKWQVERKYKEFRGDLGRTLLLGLNYEPESYIPHEAISLNLGGRWIVFSVETVTEVRDHLSLLIDHVESLKPKELTPQEQVEALAPGSVFTTGGSDSDYKYVKLDRTRIHSLKFNMPLVPRDFKSVSKIVVVYNPEEGK